MCVCSLAQSCQTLCNSMDRSPPGSSIHGILQARILGGLPCPPPGDLPNPGIEHMSPVSPALTGGFFITSTTREAQIHTRNSEDTVITAPSILRPYKIRGEGRCDSWLDSKDM